MRWREENNGMAKSQKLEHILDTLNQLRGNPISEDAIATLRQTLNSKYSVAIAQAAKLVGSSAITSLIPDLVTTFDRMMVKPADSDPGCLAKTAIAETLYRLECSAESLFLKGIRHVQMEPVWGGQEDKAAPLRATCALGLVRMNYANVMVELADLLADPLVEARMAAARAIAYSNNSVGIPLLRLRIKVGDRPAVVAECLLALLKLAPAESLDLVQNVLYGRQPPLKPEEALELPEAVALALGEARIPEAMGILKDWWMQLKDPTLRRSALLAIAMLRHDEALNFLLALIEDGMSRDAKDAIAALKMYQHDDSLWPRVCQITEQRGNADLLKELI
jgi:hypothetical protein